MERAATNADSAEGEGFKIENADFLRIYLGKLRNCVQVAEAVLTWKQTQGWLRAALGLNSRPLAETLSAEQKIWLKMELPHVRKAVLNLCNNFLGEGFAERLASGPSMADLYPGKYPDEQKPEINDLAALSHAFEEIQLKIGEIFGNISWANGGFKLSMLPVDVGNYVKERVLEIFAIADSLAKCAEKL